MSSSSRLHWEMEFPLMTTARLFVVGTVTAPDVKGCQLFVDQLLTCLRSRTWNGLGTELESFTIIITDNHKKIIS